jgi:photosystem II stability/assembly factor-like uncharacterized protein
MKRQSRFTILILSILFSSIAGYSQWKRIPSPEILIPIRTWAIAVQGDTLFAGAYRGTIYRSTDNGSAWIEVNNGLSASFYQTYTILLAGDTVYAGTNEGLYRSTDLGESWVLYTSGLPTSPDVLSLLIRDSSLFAGTTGGVYGSNDHGEHWSQIQSRGQTSSLVSIGSVIFAGGYGGVSRSTNQGLTWQDVSAGLPYRINSLMTSGTNLWAGSDYDSAGDVYFSSNQGNSWQAASTGMPQNYVGLYPAVYALGMNGGAVFAGVQDTGPYRSTDAGASWSRIGNGFPSISTITSFASSGEYVYAAPDEGLYRLNVNDTTWYPLFTTYPGKVVNQTIGARGSTLFSESYSEYWNGTIFQLYRSTDSGDSWEVDTSLKKYYAGSFLSIDSNFYAIGEGITRSSDEGAHWNEIDSGLPAFGISALTAHGKSLYAGYADYIFNGDDGRVFRSTNQGGFWSPMGLDGKPVNVLASIGPAVLAGTWGITSFPGLYRSTDDGESWNKIDSLMPPNVSVPSSFAVIDTFLFASTSRGVYSTTDFGTSWIEESNGLPQDSAGKRASISLLYPNTKLPSLGKYLFAIASEGLYSSSDLGASWYAIATGLSGSALRIHSLTSDDMYLYAATGDGMWRRPLAELITSISHSPGSSLPRVFVAEQNYPNPFNPMTTLKYDLPEDSKVHLTVTNLLGQVVATLVEDIEPAGNKSVVWNASSFASGLYFYRLEATSLSDPIKTFTQVKKMLLVR